MPDAQLEHLVKMAHQIARNLAAEGDEDHVAQKAAEHIRKFWTPAMRNRLVEHSRHPEASLPGPVAATAARLIES